MFGSILPAPSRLPGLSRTATALAVGLACLLVLAPLAVEAASPPPTIGERAMVVSPESAASHIGVEVLRGGGNAVDAAVAVAFALDVTYPLAAPLGGGGFLLYRASAAEHHALDFRETAPAALEAGMFLDEQGRPVADRSLDSGLAVGVPGSVAGLAEAHRRWGSRPWRELLEPSIRLAQRGFPVYPWLAHTLEATSAKLLARPGIREIFTRDGRPLRAGERLVQKDLARTLRRIAREGPAGFYSGPVAAALVAAVREEGGVLAAGDLERYRPVPRAPVAGSYREHRVIAFPPPGGGVTLLQMLGMLERFDLRAAGAGSSLAVHRMAEAERRAFADRARWLGDPDFADVPVDALLDPDYLAARAATIRDDRATAASEITAGHPEAAAVGETLHLSVADPAGRTVAMTLTLNAWYGSGIVARGTGVLLNNEIDDFALAPGAPNLYGLTGGEANAVAAGKRPLSSMSPTIVELPRGGPRPRLVLGSPGGATILTSVLQVLVNVVDHEMPLEEAVAAPRFHHQWLPEPLRHEPRAFPRDVERNLEARGYVLEPAERSLGNVNAIGLAEDGASWIGAADPRRQGVAVGF